jgi:hypothetical protein
MTVGDGDGVVERHQSGGWDGTRARMAHGTSRSFAPAYTKFEIHLFENGGAAFFKQTHSNTYSRGVRKTRYMN